MVVCSCRVSMCILIYCSICVIPYLQQCVAWSTPPTSVANVRTVRTHSPPIEPEAPPNFHLSLSKLKWVFWSKQVWLWGQHRSGLALPSVWCYHWFSCMRRNRCRRWLTLVSLKKASHRYRSCFYQFSLNVQRVVNKFKQEMQGSFSTAILFIIQNYR